jgi:hypothetical protein
MKLRAGSLLFGLILVVGAVLLIGTGAYAAVVRSNGTYVDLGAHNTYHTDLYGLASDSTNWRKQFFGWAGSVRLEVAGEGAKPIFVGVARPEALRVYLSGTGYTTVSAPTGGEVVHVEHPGSAPPPQPSSAVDWTTAAEGAGTLTLRWNATDRPQVVFAMNADGSRPVRVRVVASAVTLDRMPWWIPTGALALGIILLPVGVVLLRKRR